MAFIIRNLPHCIKNFFQVLSHKFFNILKHFNILITFQRFKIFKKWGQKMKIFFLIIKTKKSKTNFEFFLKKR